MTYIAIFPGQGSQRVGMGADLFPRFPRIVAQADDILGYSVERLCLQDPEQQLGSTAFTQPALYVVNALHYYASLDTRGGPPEFAAGHSLGEYNALLAAEAFDFAAGLQIVKRRGELMGRLTGGGMLAVVGAAQDTLHTLMLESEITSVDFANLNTPEQLVLAGPVPDLERLAAVVKRAVPACHPIMLRVSAAFHSRYTSSIKREFGGFLAGVRCSPLLIPVMANFTALPYRDDEIAHNLNQQIDHPVRWIELVQYLLQEHEPEFVEIGPGETLTRMVAQIKRHPVPVNIRRYY